MPIFVLAKGCWKARQLDSHFVGGGRRQGWGDGEDRCLEGLARTLLGGGLKEGVAARDWAGAERKGRWERCGPGQGRLRLRWERDWTMTVARCCAAAGSILWIGVDGFQELVCGGMDSCPWPGRAAAFQTGYFRHSEYVSTHLRESMPTA